MTFRKKDQEVEIYAFCVPEFDVSADKHLYRKNREEFDDVVVFKAVLGEYVYTKYDHEGQSNEKTQIAEYIYPWHVVKEITLSKEEVERE